MPTLSNDYLDLRSAKSTKVREWFIADLIGEATYRTSLSILGLRDGDIDHEVNTAKQEITQCATKPKTIRLVRNYSQVLISPLANKS